MFKCTFKHEKQVLDLTLDMMEKNFLTDRSKSQFTILLSKAKKNLYLNNNGTKRLFAKIKREKGKYYENCK
jgi:hypothetical protein